MNTHKILVYFMMILLLSGIAFAEKDSFVLSEEHSGNLYLTNKEIAVESNLYGDLYAVSNRIDINGLVRDDVDAVTNLFDLKGNVGSDVRVLSSTTVIDGTVFGEVMIMGNYVKITNASTIGGPVNIRAKTVIIDGTLKGDLNVNAEKVVLNGIVEGNAVITATLFELGPDAKILGDLSSTRSVDETSPQVGGIVTKLKGKDDPSNFTSITLSRIFLFIIIFLIGTVLVLMHKKSTEKVAKAMYGRFLLSMLIGFLALVVAPFVALILLFTLVGIPLAILIVAIYIILLILALGFNAIFLGKLNTKIVKKKNSLWLELLIGSLALALISIIPVIFMLVLFFIGFVAVGAMLLVVFGKRQEEVRRIGSLYQIMRGIIMEEEKKLVFFTTSSLVNSYTITHKSFDDISFKLDQSFLKKELEHVLGAENIDFRISDPFEIAQYLINNHHLHTYKKTFGGIIVPLSNDAENAIISIYFASLALLKDKPISNIEQYNDLITEQLQTLHKGRSNVSGFNNRIENVREYEESFAFNFNIVTVYEPHKQFSSLKKNQVPQIGIYPENASTRKNNFLQTPEQITDLNRFLYAMWIQSSKKDGILILKVLKNGFKILYEIKMTTQTYHLNGHYFYYGEKETLVGKLEFDTKTKELYGNIIDSGANSSSLEIKGIIEKNNDLIKMYFTQFSADSNLPAHIIYLLSNSGQKIEGIYTGNWKDSNDKIATKKLRFNTTLDSDIIEILKRPPYPDGGEICDIVEINLVRIH